MRKSPVLTKSPVKSNVNEMLVNAIKHFKKGMSFFGNFKKTYMDHILFERECKLITKKLYNVLTELLKCRTAQNFVTTIKKNNAVLGRKNRKAELFAEDIGWFEKGEAKEIVFNGMYGDIILFLTNPEIPAKEKEKLFRDYTHSDEIKMAFLNYLNNPPKPAKKFEGR